MLRDRDVFQHCDWISKGFALSDWLSEFLQIRAEIQHLIG
jgi:hypothetical protein